MQGNYLIDGPLSSEVVASLLEGLSKKPLCGGHSLFLGQVRADKIDGKIVKAIEYSAYESMVQTEADLIKKETLEQFEDVNSINIIHSTGVVKAGEISLLVLVSAGHRIQAMQACSKAVDLIKDRIPVWKKEIYEDDSHIWK